MSTSGPLSSLSESESVRTLFDDGFALRNAEEWLLQLDYSASKAQPDPILARKLERRREQVIDILISLLPDVKQIRFSPPTHERPTPQVQFRTPYGWVPLRGIAYGYQALIAWIVDLASRLVETYPHSSDPLNEPAVVLVDEIDLHLHPSWQRDLMQYLSERFPQTQFIATAHSPLIVQAAPAVNANVCVLRRNGDHVVIDKHRESVRGWRIDQILSSDLYKTSPREPEFQRLLDERRVLLAKPHLTAEDERRVGELDVQIGLLPLGESPDEIQTARLLRETLDVLRQGSPMEASQ